MTYYTRAYPVAVPSRCWLCGEPSVGLWCGLCLIPYIAAGDRYAMQPDANVITVRQAPEKGNGA